jgi:hypothetical protein
MQFTAYGFSYKWGNYNPIIQPWRLVEGQCQARQFSCDCIARVRQTGLTLDCYSASLLQRTAGAEDELFAVFRQSQEDWDVLRGRTGRLAPRLMSFTVGFCESDGGYVHGCFVCWRQVIRDYWEKNVRAKLPDPFYK